MFVKCHETEKIVGKQSTVLWIVIWSKHKLKKFIPSLKCQTQKSVALFASQLELKLDTIFNVMANNFLVKRFRDPPPIEIQSF